MSRRVLLLSSLLLFVLLLLLFSDIFSISFDSLTHLLLFSLSLFSLPERARTQSLARLFGCSVVRPLARAQRNSTRSLLAGCFCGQTQLQARWLRVVQYSAAQHKQCSAMLSSQLNSARSARLSSPARLLHAYREPIGRADRHYFSALGTARNSSEQGARSFGELSALRERAVTSSDARTDERTGRPRRAR